MDRENNRSYAANGTDVIPDHWTDYVGEEFVGTPFAEHPDAEEQYKKRVNNKEISWGSGPPINTTYVFTGLALAEDAEGELEIHPVRLSLKRSDVPAARKWGTLIQTKLRNKPSWDKTFVLETKKNSYDKGMAYNIVVSVGRDTTTDEKQAALELAQAVLAGRVADNAEGGAGEDRAVEPDAKGGLGI